MTMPLHHEIQGPLLRQVAGSKGLALFLYRHTSAIFPSQWLGSIDIVNTNRHRKRLSASGFSLIELIAVMTIMTVMLALSAPALSSFKDTVGRKGAINQLLNSFEQARVAALAQGTNVYVGFADSSNSFPEKMKCKAYIIFRDRLDSEPALPQYILLTKWIYLPQGIALQKANGDQTSLMSDSARKLLPDKTLPLVANGSINIPVLQFNSSGFIEFPSSQYLRLLIYEGFHGPNGPSFTNPTNTKFDVIAFRRFSGRAELFLSSTN